VPRKFDAGRHRRPFSFDVEYFPAKQASAAFFFTLSKQKARIAGFL
jgi:hypothetical protein